MGLNFALELELALLWQILCICKIHVHSFWQDCEDCRLNLATYTVDCRYLELAYLELPLVSKWKSGPCFTTEIYQQATKYCGKEEKLLLRSNFSSFPQYFLSNLESNYISILLKLVVRLIVFLSSANLICRSTDILKCFIESIGIRDSESRLYMMSDSVACCTSVHGCPGGWAVFATL